MMTQLEEILTVYADEMSNIIPSKVKWLQTFFPYGPVGFYEIWKKQLEAFNSYPEIWSVYVEGFKQFGNCLAFLKLLDEAVTLENTHNLVQSALFLGVYPKSDGRHVTGIENRHQTPIDFALEELSASKRFVCSKKKKSRDVIFSWNFGSQVFSALEALKRSTPTRNEMFPYSR